METHTQIADDSSTQAHALARFAELQKKLVPLWQQIGRSDPGGDVQQANTVVVIPSLTVDVELPAPMQQAYEERFLFLLFLLRQPRLRLIYVTSQSVQSAIVDYYLDILPSVIISNARKRLFMVTPEDGSSRPLSQKLLERPQLLAHIRDLIPDPDRAHMVPFNTTDLERELAVRLVIPMYAADPDYFAFGTKSGGRRLFAEEGINHPLGVENLFSVEDVIEALVRIRIQQPQVRQLIVKLNEGVGGMGNALLDLDQAVHPGAAGERESLAQALRGLRFEVPDVDYADYMKRLAEHGGVIEAFISGEEIHSPSAQLRITPLGEVEMLSTHDQMLGGPSGQTFLGARFPARPEYSGLIMSEAAKVGARLAREGIVGRFAVDFVVVRQADGQWQAYAIEINLRKGGTTTPFLTLQYLTDGMYDPDEGAFRTARGHAKYYVASDHVESEAYRVFTPEILFDIVSRHRLHFDHTSQTGIVMHMMSAVGSRGQLGVTAIADASEEADALYRRFIEVLNAEAEVAGHA